VSFTPVTSSTAAPDSGVDLVYSSVSYQLPDGVENLTLTGDANINATGNAAANVLEGNAGNNVLDGGAGNDTLKGGAGDDSYVVGNESDTIIELPGGGTDTVLSLYDYSIASLANVENVTLTGFGNFGATGNSLDNTLTGNIGANTLIGGAGNDTLIGREGADLYVFDAGFGHDVIVDHDDTTPILTDVIRFGTGITPSSVVVTRSGLDLVLSRGADSIAVQNWFASAEDKVERVEFNDGTAWDVATLRSKSNAAPTVANPIADKSATEDQAFNFAVPANAFADADAPLVDTLTYGATLADGTALPSWLGFNSATRVFSGTPLNENVGFIDVKVTATDGVSASVSDIFRVTVANTNDAPIVTNPIHDQIATETEQWTFTLPVTTFADVDAGDVLTYSATLPTGGPLPSWLTFNAQTRTFTGTPPNTAAGLEVRVNATDSAGSTVSDQFVVNVAKLFVGTQGDDVLQGTGSSDVIRLLAGNDLAWGMLGDDQILGGDGNDQLIGDDGWGGVGNDVLDGGAGDDRLWGEGGNDLLIGGDGVDELQGQEGNDTLQGGSGNDTLFGQGGDDSLDGQAGADWLIGGTGNDTYVVDVAGDAVVENAGEGTDTVFSSITWTQMDNIENLTLTGLAAIDGLGNNLDNVLTGNAGNNHLYGQGGNDLLLGGDGADELQGQDGNDTLQSGTGDDTLYGDAGNDTLDGQAGADLLFGGLGADLLRGGDGNDRLVGDDGLGGGGDDVLDGGAGDDQLWGGGGNDLLMGGDGADELQGEEGNDALQGGSGNDTLFGHAGNDTLDGQTGADWLLGGAGSDTYVFGRGYGTDRVAETDSNAGDTDVAQFLAGVSRNQLWFQQKGSDLVVSIIGTSDKLTVQDWYLGATSHVEQFRTADGSTLLESNVQNLVNAMAAFAPPPPGQETLPANYSTALNPVIAANWQ